MKLTDEHGVELDANFDLAVDASVVTIIQHSRSGARNSGRERNADYFPALELLIARLAAANTTLESVHVDSTTARELPEPERLLDVPLPIALSAETNPGQLRLALTNAQRTVARTPRSRGLGGNNHKRIRLRVRFPSSTDVALFLSDVSASRVPAGAGSHRLGAPYRSPTPDPAVSPADLFTFDPEKRERSLAGHAAVQEALAAFIRSRGHEPRSPDRGEPEFDLAWTEPDVFVAEVKSLTGLHTDRQMRLGLGQVLHYRHQISNLYGAASAVLAVEHDPGKLWMALCVELEVRLVWPGNWQAIADDRPA